MTIKAYFDGACRGNPGPGGYGFVIINGDEIIEGYELVDKGKQTTNNRAEMTGLLELLLLLKSENYDDKVIIYGDSLLVINCINGLWKKKANLDLWEIIDTLIKYNYEFKHILRHKNKLADKLANKALDELL